MRREEMLALRWSDLDLDAGTARVTRTLTYAGRQLLIREEAKTEAGNRTIDLPAFVVAALNRHKAAQAERRMLLGPEWAGAERHEDDFIIEKGDGHPWEPTGLSKCWKRWATAHGFGERVRP